MRYLIFALIIAGCTQVYTPDSIITKNAVNYEDNKVRLAFYQENGYNKYEIWE